MARASPFFLRANRLPPPNRSRIATPQPAPELMLQTGCLRFGKGQAPVYPKPAPHSAQPNSTLNVHNSTLFRRANPAIAAKPLPNNQIAAGTGTGARSYSRTSRGPWPKPNASPSLV